MKCGTEEGETRGMLYTVCCMLVGEGEGAR
jgi:hypothetical protein